MFRIGFQEIQSSYQFLSKKKTQFKGGSIKIDILTLKHFGRLSHDTDSIIFLHKNHIKIINNFLSIRSSHNQPQVRKRLSST